MFRLLLLMLLTCHLNFVCSSEFSLIPVNHQGRFRPLEAYSRFLLNDFYHSQAIRSEDIARFPLTTADALAFLIQLRLKGHGPFDDFPLFYVQSSELKQALKMNGKERLSYRELSQVSLPPQLSLEAESEWKTLKQKVILYEHGGYLPILPSRRYPEKWVDISVLKEGERNTFFAADLEEKLIHAWDRWTKDASQENAQAFAAAYREAYVPLTQHPIALSNETSLTFPSDWQLKAELLYYLYPIINYAILAYLAALFCFLAHAGFKKTLLLTMGWSLLLAGFVLHTLTILLRSYILGRPPVSNMSETVIYVPWVALIIGFILSKRFATMIPLLGAIATATCLLAIREWTFGNDALENVQAVLNSAFWLSIHVLMVVGSYGVLILGGILAHVYLLQRRKNPPLSTAILQCLYLGVALLIPGTILGGVWAAQSWGRFWDWDPKESWAFISACVYLLVIHAYRFQKIDERGLAIGAIVGLMAISFTWYGVNYILGTGLHSYGFGSGGEWIYYSFLAAESLFLGWQFKEKRMIDKSLFFR